MMKYILFRIYYSHHGTIEDRIAVVKRTERKAEAKILKILQADI